ncbi:MAG: 3'(2'),5'-bisphosphate nucleotidase CysQ [candidate division KSB1 bacterium]|nr:3'(2'),5'-bisphosphate nucleotidase CysQ [candidate division KSB1 bacterium]MDZ7273040.1 3'(2'),5'-bisphosphate nucleotidase CysQ [candidate division KSB1 bacterium]MDZ7285143.1 3'(2'),5'-bisphosphate nucleotidase CysQ [candidate division KSB1 bacterium]MDZ7298175.1 3'(2'),5'-bisphosphate nucleotidase CysQ [candidate division KSB1 bacterium]MDZ7307841.1 3'(2'),5'-bisphosphate nucleotidase CysQ [candidate division KSB1 bacterium]
MQTSELDRRVPIVGEIAIAAGAAALQYYYDDQVAIAWKSAGNPVTAADHAANETILTRLHQHFAGEAVLSEESQDDMSRLGRDLFWVVDPLDGTKEFIARNGEFSIMIGMVLAGRPALGVVYQPATRKLYFGAPGLGAWLSTSDGMQTLRVSDRTEPAQWRMVASRSHFDPRIDRVRQRLGIHEIRRSGSVGLKCGLIAAGECEVYIHPSSKVNMWDSCAPAAILLAAGGMMTDLRGEPLSYAAVEVRHRQGLVATHGRQHEQVIAAILSENVTSD